MALRILSILVLSLFLSLFLGWSPVVSAAEGPWASAGEVRTEMGFIHYRTAGKGQPLILLHGYFGQGGQWSKYVDVFGKHFTVIAPDLPGHGLSANTSENFDPELVASAMWRLLDELGYARVSGIGYSAGGMTLLAMATQQPRRIHAMVLAASAASVRSAPPQRWEDLPRGFQSDMLRNHPGGVDQVRKLLATHTIPSVDSLAQQPLRVPTLMVVGDRDESFPLPLVLATYEQLEHGRLWVIPNLGHELFWAEWGGDRTLESQFPDRVLDFFAEPY